MTTTATTTVRPLAFDTQHEDLIHDAQMDYYGRRLATGSSDRTVRLFQVEPNQPEKFICSLTGHEGPVWQVAWAHPKFGSLLASCSYDGRVIIWKESNSGSNNHNSGGGNNIAVGSGGWIKVKEHRGHESSVNSISWAPVDFGLRLACASSDGKISVLTYVVEEATWRVSEWNAHQIGCNAISWSPSAKPASLITAISGKADESANLFTELRLVSGGCDNLVKIWKYDASNDHWDLECELNGHGDWVRDVAWAPNIGVPAHTIISCSQDRTVLVWRSPDGQNWSKKMLRKEPFDDTLWRVTFSPAGNLLAVAGGDNHITMWRELANEEWECVSDVDQASLAATTTH